MLDLNMMFQHVVHCAGMAIFELLVGLVCVCVLSVLILGGLAVTGWGRPNNSADQSMLNGEDLDPAIFAFMRHMF